MIMKMGYCKCIICGEQLDNDEQTYCESCEGALEYNNDEDQEEEYE